MEETPASRTMAEIDLVKNLEKISSEIPNRVLKIQGYILKENHKEQLEIIISSFSFFSLRINPSILRILLGFLELILSKKLIKSSFSIF